MARRNTGIRIVTPRFHSRRATAALGAELSIARCAVFGSSRFFLPPTDVLHYPAVHRPAQRKIRRSHGSADFSYQIEADFFSAMTSAIVRWSRKAQLSPSGTSRAAVAFSTTRHGPCAGKPITASRCVVQAPQLLQVASV